MCESEGCGHAFKTSYGHVFCRAHALCRVDDPSTHWDPSNCSVCLTAIENFSASNLEMSERLVAQKSLRDWVYGFAKLVNKKRDKDKHLPYIAHEWQRALLFPQAKKWVVVHPDPNAGNLSDDSLSSSQFLEEEGVEPMDFCEESALLGLAGPSGSQCPSAPSGSQGVSFQEAPVEGSETSETSSACDDRMFTRYFAPFFNNLKKELMGSLDARINPLQELIKSKGTGEGGSGDPVPSVPATPLVPVPHKFKDLPKTSARNPWRCGEGYITRGEFLVKLDGSVTYPLNKLVWHPDVNHPDALFRVREEAVLCPRVSTAEEVIIQPSDALLNLEQYASSEEYTKFEPAARASSGPTFAAKEKVEFPFLKKLLMRVHDFAASPVNKVLPALLESRPVASFVPGPALWDERKELTFEHIFHSGKLDAAAASSELQEEMPKIPGDLIQKEFLCRRKLANLVSVCTISEDLGRKEQSSVVKYFPKLLFPNLVDAFFTWVKAKQACRKAVLSKFREFHETSSLLRSNFMESTLFDSKTVTKLVDSYRSKSSSLLDNWKKASPSGGVKRSASSSKSNYWKKQRYFKNPANKQPQLPAPSTSTASQHHSAPSPATVPFREDRRPPSYNQGSQSRRGGSKGGPFKSFRGRGNSNKRGASSRPT